MLSALKQIDVKEFDRIVEVGETYFLYSQKGQRGIKNRKARKRGGKSTLRGISNEQVSVLVARDRTKSTVSKVACLGRVKKSKLDTMIGSKLTPNNILVTDALGVYRTYVNEKGCFC